MWKDYVASSSLLLLLFLLSFYCCHGFTVVPAEVKKGRMSCVSSFSSFVGLGAKKRKTTNDNDNRIVDTSTISLLEHVNLNIPSQKYVKEFYGDILGMGLDPRRAQNVVKGEGTVWFNCGASQFHLPHGTQAQVWNGHLGLYYSNLEPLVSRLEQYSTTTPNSQTDPPFADYSIARTNDNNSNSNNNDDGQEVSHIRIMDHYGNVFFCRQQPPIDDDDDESTKLSLSSSLKQPLLQSSNPQHVETYGADLCHKYGENEDEDDAVGKCGGLKYVEYWIPTNTASKVAIFYDCIFDASTTVMEEDGVCLVACGSIDSNGRAEQYMIFRECHTDLPPYDGHHVAMYVGTSQEDFEEAFQRCAQAGIVWVNPRFSDCATTLDTARQYNQFRFKDILDIDTGKVLFQLEHEIRSVHHPAHPSSSHTTTNNNK